MIRRLTMLGMFAVSLLLVANFVSTEAQDKPPANEVGGEDWVKLEIAYAEANLQLAQARLAIAERENKRLANSVASEALASLQAGVALAQDRLTRLQESGDPTPYAGFIAEAEARLNGARRKYQESLRANNIDEDAVPQAILAREQADIAVAESRLAMLKVLHDQPVNVRIIWEIRQIQDEIRSLWNRPLIRN